MIIPPCRPWGAASVTPSACWTPSQPAPGSFVGSGQAALVPPEWVLLGDLNQDDAHTVRVCDPHLLQAPNFAARLPQDPHPSIQQSSVLGSNVPDLQPKRDRVARWVPRPAADLKQAVAQEEHDAAGVIPAELAVNP